MRYSAFNAFVSSSVVALDLSYAMPIAVNCLRGRNCPPEREWRLLRRTGWVVDIVHILVFANPAMRLDDWNAGCPVLYCAGHCAVSLSPRLSSDGKQYE